MCDIIIIIIGGGMASVCLVVIKDEFFVRVFVSQGMATSAYVWISDMVFFSVQHTSSL